MANNTLFENQLNALNENEIKDFVQTQLLKDLKGVSQNAFEDVLNRAWEQKIVSINEQEFISKKPRPAKDLELVKCVILRGKEAIVKFLLAYADIHPGTDITNYFGNMAHQSVSGPSQSSAASQSPPFTDFVVDKQHVRSITLLIEKVMNDKDWEFIMQHMLPNPNFQNVNKETHFSIRIRNTIDQWIGVKRKDERKLSDLMSCIGEDRHKQLCENLMKESEVISKI